VDQLVSVGLEDQPVSVGLVLDGGLDVVADVPQGRLQLAHIAGSSSTPTRSA
jgi:hypothetical protein